MNDLIITTPDSFRQMISDILDEKLAKLSQPKNDEAPRDKKSLAKYLGISISTLEKLMKANEIKYFNIGNQPRFTWEEIEAYIKRKV